MLFEDTLVEEIARAPVGEAFFFTEGYHGPRRLHTINLHEDMPLAEPLLDAELLEYIHNDSWYRDNAKQRVSLELAQLNELLDLYDAGRRTRLRRIAKLSASLKAVFTHPPDRIRRGYVMPLLQRLKSLRQELVTDHRTFRFGPYRTLLPGDCNESLPQQFKKTRARLIHRFEASIHPEMQSYLARVDAVIARLELLTE